MMNPPPVSSRAALTELERQLGKRPLPPVGGAPRAAGSDKGGAAGGEPKKKGGSSKGSGRKEEVQRNPEDQKGRANPQEGEGRGAE